MRLCGSRDVDEVCRDLDEEARDQYDRLLAYVVRSSDDLFVNLVHAGEVGGILDTILNRLAMYIEKNVKLKRQVRGALTYPIAVILILIVVMVVLLTFVIPAFENMFAEFGAKDALPKLTQIVIAVSNGFVSYLPVVIIVTILADSSIAAAAQMARPAGTPCRAAPSSTRKPRRPLPPAVA